MYKYMPVDWVVQLWVLFFCHTGVPGGERGQRVWLHRPALPGPAAAAAGPGASPLQCARLPLQPVWPTGARQQQGDREFCPPHLQCLFPHV